MTHNRLSLLTPALALFVAFALAPASVAQPVLIDNFEDETIGPGEFVFGGGEAGALSLTTDTPDGTGFAVQFDVDIDEYGGFTGFGQPIDGGAVDISGFTRPVVVIDAAATGTFELEANFQNTGGGGEGEFRSVFRFVDGDGTWQRYWIDLASFFPTNAAVFDLDDVFQYVFTVGPNNAIGDGDNGTQETQIRLDNIMVVEGLGFESDLAAFDFDSGDYSDTAGFFYFAGGEGITASATMDTPDGSPNAFSGAIDGDEFGGFAGFGTSFPGAPIDISATDAYNFFLRTNGPAVMEISLQTVEGSGLFEAREVIRVGDTGGDYIPVSIPLDVMLRSGPNTPDFSQVINFVFTFVQVPGDGDVGTTEFEFSIDALGFGTQMPAGGGMTAPEIAVSTASVDFGTVDVGSSDQQTVTITNEGDGPLMVSSIAVTGGEFAITDGGMAGTIAPGMTQDVVVEFAPTAAGPQAGTLTIASNDMDEATVTVDLAGTGNMVPPPVCAYGFEVAPRSGLTAPSSGGRIRFVYGINNLEVPTPAMVDIWARVTNENGTTVQVRRPRTVMVPANSVLTAGYNQRVPGRVDDGSYTYTFFAGTFNEADPSMSEICGTASFTITKQSQAITGSVASATVASAAAKGLVASDWQDIEIVDETVKMGTLAVAAEEVRLAPNPTRGAATFAFGLADDADVSIALYDVRGREVASVLDGPLQAGAHTVTLGRDLPAGVYVWRLVAGDRVETGRLTVVR